MNIEQLRAAAANLRKNPQDKQSLSVLVTQLTDRRGIYRVNAAAVLGEAADHVSAAIAPEAVPALAGLLDKGDQYDQSAAARALARFGEHARPALPVLRKKLKPSERDVAWFSANAIGNIGAPAVEALPDLLGALKEQVDGCSGYFSTCCEYFIPAIGNIGPSAINAIPDLEAVLDRPDPYLRLCAAVASIGIDGHNQSAYEEIAKLLKSADVEARHRTLITLKRSGSAARAVKPLIEFAKNDLDEDIRKEAGELLLKLN